MRASRWWSGLGSGAVGAGLARHPGNEEIRKALESEEGR
jgi:hypothetical protein